MCSQQWVTALDAGGRILALKVRQKPSNLLKAQARCNESHATSQSKAKKKLADLWSRNQADKTTGSWLRIRDHMCTIVHK